MLYTLSAVQVLALYDKLNVLDIDKVSSCILVSLFGGFEVVHASFMILFIMSKQSVVTRTFLSNASYVVFVSISTNSVP